MFASIHDLLEKLIRNRLGALPLRVVLWNGRSVSLSRRTKLTVRLRSAKALRYLVQPSFMSLGTAYVEGLIDVDGPAEEAIQVIESWNDPSRSSASARRWKPRRRSLKQDAKAVQYHYDVSNDFYRLWLDRNMVYSCAYFRSENDTLDRAQEQKLDHICKKLMLKPGERLLDIGCGWGGLIRWAAKNYGVRATGITLSQNQLKHARQMIRDQKLSKLCDVQLCDYRNLKVDKPFDKIASVGMFEHVGIAQLPVYFETVDRLLKENGVVLNHGICSSGLDSEYVAGDAGKFIEKYVFPFSELPHMSLAAREMSRTSLEITDIESLRPHYARTLRHWLERFESNQKKIESASSARQYRIWRAYLAGSAHAFDRGWISIYQIAAMKRPKTGIWSLPWTRDHLYDTVSVA